VALPGLNARRRQQTCEELPAILIPLAPAQAGVAGSPSPGGAMIRLRGSDRGSRPEASADPDQTGAERQHDDRRDEDRGSGKPNVTRMPVSRGPKAAMTQLEHLIFAAY